MLTADYLDSGFGGVEWHVYNLSRALMRAGVDVRVIRTGRRKIAFEAPRDVPFEAVPGRALPQFPRSLLQVLPGPVEMALAFSRRVSCAISSLFITRKLRDAMRAADVVHQHDFMEGWGGARRASAFVPVVWTNHLGEFLAMRKHSIGRAALRTMTAHFSAAIAPSTELADTECIASVVARIPNGVDLVQHAKRSEADRAVLREELGWGDEMVVLVPRRWAPTKGVIFAAEAASLDEWPDGTRLVFAGAGAPEYPGYASRVREHLERARARIEVHDHLRKPDMVRALAAADVCLVPSLQEATSLSVLEAMASGLPIISTTVGGLSELVENGTNGLQVEPASASAIAAAVSTFAGLAQGEKTRMSENAVATASEFSWDAIAARTMEIYRDAVR